MQTVKIIRPSLQLPQILTDLLPLTLSDAISKCGAPRAEELRLHRDRYASVTCGGKNYFTDVALREREMHDIFKKMCGGSIYAHANTIRQGYLSLPNGIRVGVCGSAAMEENRVIGVDHISGLIVRIPNAPKINVEPLAELLRQSPGMGGILIYAPPGMGKTTLLRSLATSLSEGVDGRRVVVVDTREELSPTLGGVGHTLDVLVGYPRALGIEIAVRSLGAEWIVCDEIGSPSDAEAILQAANCGVPIIATAHACTAEELLRRPAIQRLHQGRVFRAYVGIQRHPEQGFRYTVTKREEKDDFDLESAWHDASSGSGGLDRPSPFSL